MSAGSSPRVRGTHNEGADDHRRVRFIPACAGNSASSAPPATSAPVHPRVCGELLGYLSIAPDQTRFIPACAGNSFAGRGAAWAVPVHPRVCGELVALTSSSSADAGSSPRVRGTRSVLLPRQIGRRFIPACAGNSPRAAAIDRPRPVHPRVCGELALTDVLSLMASGSSPRVRGTRGRRCCWSVGGRFIPACAGNSQKDALITTPNSGSSPRVRGTPSIVKSPSAESRFIPACAGNSRCL